MLQCGCSLHFVILVALVTSASAVKKTVHFAIEADGEILAALNDTSSKTDVSEARSESPQRIADILGCVAGAFGYFPRGKKDEPPTLGKKPADAKEAEAILGANANLHKLFWEYYAFWQIKSVVRDGATSAPSWKTLLGNARYQPYGTKVKTLGSGTFGYVTLHKVPDARKKETTVFEFMDDDHIIDIYEVFFTPLGMFIVSEVMEGGELEDYPFNNDTFARTDYPAFAQSVALDTGLGLEYMHKEGLIHRDLKLPNVMLKTKWVVGKQIPRAKLIDFGMSEFLGEKKSTKVQGTPDYVAPEIICGQEYAMSVDVWSFGVLIWALNFGSMPFNPAANIREDLVMNSLYARIKQFQISDRTVRRIGQKEARDLCTNYIFVGASSRLTISQVLQHPYFVLDYMNPISEEAMRKANAKFKASIATSIELGKVKQEILRIGNEIRKFGPKDGPAGKAEWEGLKQQMEELLAQEAALQRDFTELANVNQEISQTLAQISKLGPQFSDEGVQIRTAVQDAAVYALNEKIKLLFARKAELETT